MINEIKKLVDELNSYRMKYYNGEDTGVTDEEFDFKERRLKELDPEYFINAPTAFNASNFNGKQFEETLTNFKDAMKDSEKNMANT